MGWYRREFEIPASDAGRRIAVEFDGAFRDVLVFVNGCFIGRNDNGYAPFRFDITDFLAIGAKNYIVARVDASFGDGWFYEGAGIYRHVWLTKTDALHLGQWESYVRTAVERQRRDADSRHRGRERGQAAGNATVQLADSRRSGQDRGHRRSRLRNRSPPMARQPSQRPRKLANPALWSPDAPNLYSAIVTVESDGKPRDAERVTFGVRTVRFDADKGFFLNGKPLKIQGTCNHQDHAGVGAALPDRLQCFPPRRAARRWAATPCAPRTTCPRRSGSRPATAWA